MDSCRPPESDVQFELTIAIQVGQHGILDTFMLDVGWRIAEDAFPLGIKHVCLRAAQRPGHVVPLTAGIHGGTAAG